MAYGEYSPIMVDIFGARWCPDTLFFSQDQSNLWRRWCSEVPDTETNLGDGRPGGSTKKKAWTAEIPNEIQLLNLCILKCDVKNMVCFQIITIFNDFYITTIESLLEQFGSKSP